jgi:hypothetical protein
VVKAPRRFLASRLARLKETEPIELLVHAVETWRQLQCLPNRTTSIDMRVVLASLVHVYEAEEFAGFFSPNELCDDLEKHPQLNEMLDLCGYVMLAVGEHYYSVMEN